MGRERVYCIKRDFNCIKSEPFIYNLNVYSDTRSYPLLDHFSASSISLS